MGFDGFVIILVTIFFYVRSSVPTRTGPSPLSRSQEPGESTTQETVGVNWYVVKLQPDLVLNLN